MKFAPILFLPLALCVLIGCNNTPDSSSNSSNAPSSQTNGGGEDSISLIATTGQINAALAKVTEGTGAKIRLFCGPGVDPHSFSASTNDVQAMLDADLIVYNGFHLEAKLSEHLHDTFHDKAWAMADAFPNDDRLDWVEDGEVDDEAPFDPHIWNHLPAWSECVKGMADRLAKADPDNAEKYSSNAEAYVKELMEAHDWAKGELNKLPADRRIIVSAHDAFNYFAKVYDMETLAVLGIGNDPEADIKTMRSVAEKICDKKIPAIFMESITNPKITQALKEACQSRDWNVEIVKQQLYSDDLGEMPPVDTFVGAFRSNVEIICKSLGGE